LLLVLLASGRHPDILEWRSSAKANNASIRRLGFHAPGSSGVTRNYLRHADLGGLYIVHDMRQQRCRFLSKRFTRIWGGAVLSNSAGVQAVRGGLPDG